jgi:hypothetical protein
VHPSRYPVIHPNIGIATSSNYFTKFYAVGLGSRRANHACFDCSTL